VTVKIKNAKGLLPNGDGFFYLNSNHIKAREYGTREMTEAKFHGKGVKFFDCFEDNGSSLYI